MDRDGPAYNQACECATALKWEHRYALPTSRNCGLRREKEKPKRHTYEVRKKAAKKRRGVYVVYMYLLLGVQEKGPNRGGKRERGREPSQSRSGNGQNDCRSRGGGGVVEAPNATNESQT